MALWFGALRGEAAQNVRVQVDQKGDFLLIGNTLGYDCQLIGGNPPPAPVVGTVGACGNNAADSGIDILWRSDSPMAGQAEASTGITVANARSTAILNIPAGATVTHAYLYWSATRSSAGADTTATLDRPGGFTQDLTATQSYTSTQNSYQSVADITAIVQAQGSGAYRVSGVDVENPVGQGVNDETTFAGWWMVVLYERASDPPRNLTIFDGFDIVASANPQNVTLSGFLVPPAFADARLGVVAFEGDTTVSGDSFSFDGMQLTNVLNPADNFFNRTRSNLGSAVTVVGDLPQLDGTAGSYAGMDMDIVDITAQLTAGQTSAPISATSVGDQYWLAGFVTSIPTFKPAFSTSTKTAVDVNGGALLPGDQVEYTIVVTNTGNDTAINTVLTDPIPMGVSYVPGSIAIVSGPNAGMKTDAKSDDQGEYDAGTNTVRIRLGIGATGAVGGTMLYGETTTVRFRVTVNQDASGTINNQATITAAGQQGAPADETPTDGNGSGNGEPPTPIVIDQCASNANCMAPTPVCNVAGTPNTCVECVTDATCGGATPKCNVATNTCTCVPFGMEVCDGIDNDCNGTIDDGFNVGMACSAGVGACMSVGTFVCIDGSTSACDAFPGMPGTETCNNVDDDCDGETDEGFDVGTACSVGVGACMATGVLACDAMGNTACDATPGTPGVEVCGDGIDNNCDGTTDMGCQDSDGDGLPDDVEIELGTNPSDPDSDDDGKLDGADNCPLIGNSDQKDIDGDGTGDVCDEDADGDDVPNTDDNCVFQSNPEQEDGDGDEIGDACDPDVDSDGDGVANPFDNCPAQANSDQKDVDGDRFGDACDPDTNVDPPTNDAGEDGILDDNCPYAVNPDQEDLDEDGIGDTCDADQDGDGLPNDIDPCPLDARSSCPNPAGEVEACACRTAGTARPLDHSAFWLALGLALYGARRRLRPRR
ncbi:thrombospondin type 3 repeat-containing protein [Polyangium spumosum]|nr:thrombospondin type 3 repeat-containing protein [Polyangium spumosum]